MKMKLSSIIAIICLNTYLNSLCSDPYQAHRKINLQFTKLSEWESQIYRAWSKNKKKNLAGKVKNTPPKHIKNAIENLYDMLYQKLGHPTK